MSFLRPEWLAVPDASEQIPDSHRRAAVAIVLSGDEVLLMRRAEREGDRWSGQISLPGGHAEDADLDLAHTARRETQEEVGVDLDAAESLGALAPVQARARGKKLSTTILPVGFRLDRDEVEFQLGVEAAEAFWFPLDRAADFAGEYRYRDGELVRKLPCWEFESRTIWGLTHGILSSIL